MKSTTPEEWGKVWTIQPYKRSKDQLHLFDFLMAHFIRLFGKEIMLRSPCTVTNEPQKDNAYFYAGAQPRISLKVARLWDWSDTVFQLSHEMCHYAMSQARGGTRCCLSWFEEIVCEAIALYSLAYAAGHWRKCSLAKARDGEPAFFRETLEKCFRAPWNDRFSNCRTPAQLEDYESRRLSESDRSSHRIERNLVYQAMVAYPGDISRVTRYDRYRSSCHPIVIDFDRWLRDEPSPLLLTLKLIQPFQPSDLPGPNRPPFHPGLVAPVLNRPFVPYRPFQPGF